MAVDLNRIHIDIIRLFAADSYCVWQLMRLTCRKYRDMLGIYNKIVSFTTHDMVRTQRHEFIKNIFSMAMSNTSGVRYTTRVVGRLIRIVEQEWTAFDLRKQSDVLLVFYDAKYREVFTIAKSWTYTGTRIRLLNVPCTYTEGDYYRGRSVDYFHYNMPELYRNTYVLQDCVEKDKWRTLENSDVE